MQGRLAHETGHYIDKQQTQGYKLQKDNMMVEVFKRIPESIAILHRSGCYYTAELYSLDSGVYAKTGNKYIRLSTHDTSTNLRVYKIVSAVVFEEDRLGRLIFKQEMQNA